MSVAAQVARVPELPLLAPWYRLVEEGDAVVLEHAHRAVVLEGAAVRRLLPALLPLLDGTRPLEQIVEAVGAPAAEAVRHALALLAGKGLLVAGPPLRCAGEARAAAEQLAAAAGLAPASVAARIASARVGVAGAARAAGETARLLRRAGIGELRRRALTGAPGDDDLVVVAPAQGELEALERWNARALHAGTPWLQLLPFDGRLAAVGPLFLPGETACAVCYRIRRAGADGLAGVGRALERVPPRASAGPALTAAAAAVAAEVALRWLAGRDPRLPGVLFALESGGGPALSEHAVLRVPRCPACSPASALAPPAPWFEAVA